LPRHLRLHLIHIGSTLFIYTHIHTCGLSIHTSAAFCSAATATRHTKANTIVLTTTILAALAAAFKSRPSDSGNNVSNNTSSAESTKAV
jgi:hypothetical protein